MIDAKTDTVENFFHTPKSTIEFAESVEYFTYDEHPEEHVGKYAGSENLEKRAQMFFCPKAPQRADATRTTKI